MTKTKVIYRKFKDGEVIALFPQIPSDNIGYFCESYMHIGQHGGADYDGLISVTKLCINSEYQALHSELQSIGYDLTVSNRANPSDRLMRMKEARK